MLSASDGRWNEERSFERIFAEQPQGRRELPVSALRRRFSRNSRLKRARHRLEYWGLKGLANLIPHLSRRHVLRLASALGWAAYRIDRRGRRLAEQNLATASQTGRLELKDGEIHAIVRDCYQNFARNFIDLFWHSRLSQENISEWVDFEGIEAIEEIRSGDRPGILLTPHFGSFEWSSLIVGLLGIKLDIVVRDFRNQLVKSVFTDARQANGHKVFDNERVVLRLLRSLHRGTSVAMLTDLNVPPQRASASIDMFGKDSSLSTLPAELAIRCSATIIAAICEPLPHGRVKLKIIKVIDPRLDENLTSDSARQYTQAIWESFEEEIRRRPDCWLWMYKHWKFCANSDISDTTNLPKIGTAYVAKAA